MAHPSAGCPSTLRTARLTREISRRACFRPMTRPSGQLDHLADLYRQMFVIRRVEEEAARAYAQGKIGGFLHLYIGEEAVAPAPRPG